MIDFKGSHFERAVILWGVRWYVAYPMSYRQLKSFRSAAATLSGIELMHMIRKGQLRTTGELRPAQKFYALAA